MGIFHCHVSLPEGSFVEGRSQPLLFQVFCFFSHYEDSTEMLEVQTPDKRVVEDDEVDADYSVLIRVFFLFFLLLKVFVVEMQGKTDSRNGKHLGFVIRYSLPTSYELWFKTTLSMWIAGVSLSASLPSKFQPLGWSGHLRQMSA